MKRIARRRVGDTMGLCYNPEFIALGSVVRDMLSPDMILIGESDAKAGDILESIYDKACENKPAIQRMSLVNAELTKIAVNTFVTTKISYANMLADLCDRLPGADVDVVDARDWMRFPDRNQIPAWRHRVRRPLLPSRQCGVHDSGAIARRARRSG